MRKTTSLLWIGVFLLSCLACKDELEDADVIQLSSGVLTFECENGEQTVLVSSTNADWTVTTTTTVDWIFPEQSASGDKFVVSVDANDSYAVRSAVLVVKGGNCIREIDVLQKGKPLSLELTAETGKVYDLNTRYAVGVKTGQKWKATVEGNWLTINKADGEGNDIILMNFSRNTSAQKRVGKVVVTAEDQTMRVFTLEQEGVLPDGALQDSLAVVALYHSLKGENWKNQNKWLTEAPLGDWSGVITDENGRVTSLVVSEALIGNKIGAEGFICEEVKYLSAMKQFSVLLCEVGGEIPNAIGRCIKLQNFSLSNYASGYQGNVNGKLPAIFAALPELISIDVTQNKLSGELPWEMAISSYVNLDVTSNAFSGELPEVWYQSPMLANIVLSFNSLSGVIPEMWGKMANMGVLDLAGNKALTGTVPEEICRRIKIGSIEVLALDGTEIIPCQ